MRKVVVALTVLALAVSSVGTSSPANAATPVVVRLPACVFTGGGEATVPAGSEVTIGIAWISMARGGVQQFLGAVEATADVDGIPIDAENFGPITHDLVPLGGSRTDLPSYWGTQWSHDLGTLNEGDEVVVTANWSLTKRILDVNLNVSPPAFWVEAGPLFGGTCTIRAVSEE